MQASFNPANALPRDNAISLQSAAGGNSDEVFFRVRAGRTATIGEDDELPDPLLIEGLTRVRFDLRYDPNTIEFQGYDPGDFFEAAAPGSQVSYVIEERFAKGQPVGLLSVDISIPASSQDQQQGDLATLRFIGTDVGFSILYFKDWFGEVYGASGELLTGMSYYGGNVRVKDTTRR